MSRDREEVSRHIVRAARATLATPLPLALVVLLIALAAIAEEGSDEDPTAPPPLEIARDFDAALARGAKFAPQDILDQLDAVIDEYRPEAAGFADDARRIFEKQVDVQGIDSGYQSRYIVFVSSSMPPGSLPSASELAVERGDMDIVFRGVMAGESVVDFARRISSDEAGRVIATIDPRLFREHGIDRAPAVLDAREGKIVFGTVNPDNVETADDRAVIGPTFPLVETDLIDTITDGVREQDWQRKAEAALRSFWSHAPMIPLPPATEPAERRIDARFRLPHDFALPDGTVLYKAGELIDPTLAHPFTLTLIVFSGLRDEEMKVVKRALHHAEEPVLMVTELPADGGWDRLLDIEKELGLPVYLMPDEVRRRFRIERTVSIVTAARGEFLVRELPADARSNVVHLPGRR